VSALAQAANQSGGLFVDFEAGAGGDGATVGSSQYVQAASLKDAAQRAEDAAARAQLAASGTETAVLFGASSTPSSREEFLPQSIYTMLRYEDLVKIAKKGLRRK
jgi:hypothetical protein